MSKRVPKPKPLECGDCAFCESPNDNPTDHACHRYPPVIVQGGGTAFPRVRARPAVINVKVPEGADPQKVQVPAFWCGEHRPRRVRS